MKILHYAVLLMHFNDKNAKRETYPQWSNWISILWNCPTTL
jgi:hypothetical protein